MTQAVGLDRPDPGPRGRAPGQHRGERILIHCPLNEGGIAEHTHYQANALARAGVATVVLSSPGFLPGHADKRYGLRLALMPPYAKRGPRLLRALWMAVATLANELILAWVILATGHRRVLLAASSEQLALVRVWPHAALRWLGVRYAANIHDPRRKRLRGWAFLHRWSIAVSYWPVSIGLIHEDFDAVQPDIPEHVRCVRVPYGCYEATIGPGNGEALRAALSPAGSGRRVFLAFGYLADRKNLDLAIRAIADIPEAALLAVGRVASRHDRPAEWYRGLARDLGCAERVRIDDGFLPESRVGQYFGAADFVLLTYKAEFVSQSGVLLLASNWGKPVVASSGPGPLRATVRRFDLGPTVPPDDVAALRAAMKRLIASDHGTGGWAAFRAHASWDRNVALLREAFAQESRAEQASEGDGA